MKIILAVIFIIIIINLEIVGQQLVSFRGINPNLILSLMLVLVLRKDFNSHWKLILFLALISDAFSGFQFGLTSISLLISVGFIDLVRKKFLTLNNILGISVLTVVSTFTYHFLLIFLNRIFNLNLSFNFYTSSLAAVYNIILVVVLLYGTKKIFC